MKYMQRVYHRERNVVEFLFVDGNKYVAIIREF